jgi:hypothetical protein
MHMRHAVEFARGQLVHGAEKSIVAREGGEVPHIGLDHVGILRARRANDHVPRHLAFRRH